MLPALGIEFGHISCIKNFYKNILLKQFELKYKIWNNPSPTHDTCNWITIQNLYLESNSDESNEIIIFFGYNIFKAINV